MTWYGIIATITKLTELDDFTSEACEKTLECKFEQSNSSRLRSDSLQDPFEFAEFNPGPDKTILALSFQDTAPREEYAKRVTAMGRPVDVEIVYPPLANVNTPKLSWDRKLNLCYEFGDCPVWFGIEETGAQKKLVKVSIQITR